MIYLIVHKPTEMIWSWTPDKTFAEKCCGKDDIVKAVNCKEASK